MSPQIGQSCPQGSDTSVLSKEYAAINAAQNAAATLSAGPLNQDSIWRFLEIEPCGPLPFRTLLENGWAARNGGPYSAVIANALNAFESVEGEKPPHCAPLFKALDKLRKRERPRSAAGQPNHAASAPRNVLSPEGARRLKEYGVIS